MWTRIEHTPLELKAHILMNKNEIDGCAYHNNSHVAAMYKYLHDTQEPYDEALDWAVLFHDAVYDVGPNKEERSADKFLELVAKSRGCNLDTNGIDRVQFLILNTEDHLVKPEHVLAGSSAIIRADLHAFADPSETIKNFAKILQESVSLYGYTAAEFGKANVEFMRGLSSSVEHNKILDPEYRFFYDQIQEGIQLVIHIAKEL